MLIIIEGCDGSGKSTLMKKLNQNILSNIMPTTGRQTQEEQLATYKEFQRLANLGSIYIKDRAFLYSERVYTHALKQPVRWNDKALHELAVDLPHLVIYTRLEDKEQMAKNMSREIKAHKSPEFMEKVLAAHGEIVDRYDAIMQDAVLAGTKVIKFDWQHDSIEDLVSDVHDFWYLNMERRYG